MIFTTKYANQNLIKTSFLNYLLYLISSPIVFISKKIGLSPNNLTSSCLEKMIRSELIIFLTPGYILDTRYLDFFHPLIESGIIQTCPKSASDLVISVYENPIIWWNSEKIQTARELFLKNLILDIQR